MGGISRSKSGLSALLRLTRFWNLLIIGGSQYAAAILLVRPSTLLDPRLLILSISVIVIAAAGYIINDYYDVKIDLINKPDRVVIGNKIPRRYAILFHTALSVLGVGLGLLLNWKIGLINFLSAFLLWWYSNELKRQPFIGNLVISLLTGMSVELVNLFYGINDTLVTVYAVFAFFITLIREIIKDMEDVKGDYSFGCKTLPIVFGIRKTKGIIYLLLAVFVIVVIALSYQYTELPVNYFVMFLFPAVLFLSLWLGRADTVRDFYRLSIFCKVIMVLGIVSMAFA
jgi:4-hydroxybenzoate polyprenyltransferase